MSVFDKIKKTAFDRVTNLMGELNAVWQKEGGDVTGAVLFNDPTEKYRINGADFEPTTPWFEYHVDVFEGLFEAVNSGDEVQVIVIKETEYVVQQVTKKHDGDTFVADVVLKT